MGTDAQNNDAKGCPKCCPDHSCRCASSSGRSSLSRSGGSSTEGAAAFPVRCCALQRQKVKQR